MKRLLCLSLSLLLLAGLCACKPKREAPAESQSPTSNLKSYAAKGRIDTLSELKIGDSPSRVAAYYQTTLEALDLPPGGAQSGEPGESSEPGESETAESPEPAEETPLIPALQKISDGSGLICLQAEDMRYYYNENDMESGIIMMVCFKDAYMLTVDYSDPDLVRAMAGKPDREGTGDDSIWFFLFSYGEDEERYYMEYEFGSFRATFYFVDGALLGVSLCNHTEWDAVHPRSAGEDIASATDESSETPASSAP